MSALIQNFESETSVWWAQRIVSPTECAQPPPRSVASKSNNLPWLNRGCRCTV